MEYQGNFNISFIANSNYDSQDNLDNHNFNDLNITLVIKVD